MAGARPTCRPNDSHDRAESTNQTSRPSELGPRFRSVVDRCTRYRDSELQAATVDMRRSTQRNRAESAPAAIEIADDSDAPADSTSEESQRENPRLASKSATRIQLRRNEPQAAAKSKSPRRARCRRSRRT